MKVLRVVLAVFMAVSLLACSEEDGPATNDVAGKPSSNTVKADLCDIVFNSSRVARDKTGTLDVLSNLGSYLSVYHNQDYNLYSAVYSGTPGNTVGSGYYRMHYSENTAFQKALKNGFSMELLVKPDVMSSTVGLFASLEDGGFGLKLASSKPSFTVCCDQEVTISGSALESGKYYHIVAVWDFIESKATLYVDGTLVASKTTVGNLRFPTDENARWIALGANCNDNVNYARQSFNGEIALARIYDNTLSEDNITSMYAKLRRPQTASSMSFSEVAFLNPCKFAHGYTYHIYGKGFAQGDKVVFESVTDKSDHVVCDATVQSEKMTVVLPSQLQTDSYLIYVKRGDNRKLLGNVSFTLSDNPDVKVKTGVLAHRCWHTNSSAGPYENSFAAFQKTLKSGIYGAEFDCWSTLDGVVVVWHDAAFNGIQIQNSKYEALKNQKMPDGSPLATLESFIIEGLKYPESHLAFEIKRHASKEANDRCVVAVADLLKKYKPSRSQITVTSFQLDILKSLRGLMKMEELNLALHGDLSPDELLKNGIDGMAYNMNILSAHPEWIEQAKAKNMSVTCWLPSKIEDMATFIGLGVDAMTVNDVSLAKKMTERVYLSK